MQGVAHHERLVLAMAWATLVVMCVGVEEAQARLARHRPQKQGRQVRHARESVFTLGVRKVRGWLYGTSHHRLPWHLPDINAISWQHRWYQAQAIHLIFFPVRP